MDVREVLSRNLKRVRQLRGLSQEELAFRSELHRTYVSGVERGIRNPSIMILQRMAAALDVQVWELLKD